MVVTVVVVVVVVVVAAAAVGTAEESEHGGGGGDGPTNISSAYKVMLPMNIFKTKFPSLGVRFIMTTDS